MTTITTDITDLVKVIDDVHAIAHTLDGHATQLRQLIDDGVQAVDTVKAEVVPVEHVATGLYDAIVSLGRDGFTEAVKTVRGLLDSAPAAPSTPPPTSGTATPDVPDVAPVAGATPDPAPAEVAPVAGATDPGAAGDAAPGVQH